MGSIRYTVNAAECIIKKGRISKSHAQRAVN